LNFYEGLIGTREQREHKIDLEAVGIQQHDLHMLESPISEEEVWNIIKHLLADKAPRLDGSTTRLYKTCWYIIKGDIMAAVLVVWRMDFRLLNTAFITLIPKKDDATQVGDFKAISLIHSFSKLLMKTLANRLAARLDTLVPKNQSDFIKERFIQDNFMLVQQMTRFLHTQKQPRIMLKLDIVKPLIRCLRPP
jgi:hypothetical protein